MKTRLLKRLREEARTHFRIEPDTGTSRRGYWLYEWSDYYRSYAKSSDSAFYPSLEMAVVAYNRNVKEKFISLANEALYKRHVKYIERKTKGRLIWDTPVKIS